MAGRTNEDGSSLSVYASRRLGELDSGQSAYNGIAHGVGRTGNQSDRVIAPHGHRIAHNIC